MFEVGKKYKSTYASEKIWTCGYVGKIHAFLENSHGACCIPFNSNDCWKEYVPHKPLTFADLKVGEKFRVGGVCGNCVKLQGTWFQGCFYDMYLVENTFCPVRVMSVTFEVEKVV